ncbi:MAG: ABC transporter substrate-binding protein [Proteobacteria bacterium]|nr:ABC transporter substrate-binding protein [Pseudomonadota bacterium]
MTKTDQRITLRRRPLLAGAAAALATPFVARAQGTAKSGTVKVGMPTILSGAIALLGTSQRNAAEMEIERINAAGGLAGRKIELVVRDSKGQPQEAARVVRELVNTDGCEIIMDAEASSAAFAVQEVIRDLGVLCIHTSSETSSLTADPKLRVATAFRCARQGVHDSIVGGSYAAKVADAKKWTKWATCSPDYAYGHDTTTQFLDFFKHFKPDVEIITQAWPKLGAPDFTEVITKLIQAKPQALFSLLYAGDLSAFINQANVYALFSNMAMFDPNMGDYPVLTAVKSLPAGIYSGTRYLENFPDLPANAAWGEAYRKRFNQFPTNWSWQNSTAWMLAEAAAKKAGSLDAKKMSEALTGLTIDCPFGVGGKVTMRDDHTLVNYAVGWGRTTPKMPYVIDIEAGDWKQLYELEAAWKKQMNYT